jgi:hypothetical protein
VLSTGTIEGHTHSHTGVRAIVLSLKSSERVVVEQHRWTLVKLHKMVDVSGGI